MRILLIGASGFIGASVAARLKREGHYVVGLGRGGEKSARRLAVDEWVRLDLRHALTPEAWLPHLEGVEAVVNCAGVLQDSVRDSTALVHRDAPIALWRACEQAGVQRVIQLSAEGAGSGVTQFSRTKGEGDEALASSSLDWALLRPSVVVGRAAYGGSALFRGLAAFPILPRTEDGGPLEIVQLDDVAETVAVLLRPGAPSRVVLELSGPDRLGFDEVVAAYRAWLGWAPARLVATPDWLMGLAYRTGDLIAKFGWRPPVRSTARLELARGAVGDNRGWRAATGIEPRSLRDALRSEPASVQERWFARLYFLRVLAIGTFALFWLLTALVSLGPGYELAKQYMLRAGAGPLSGPTVVAGALADIAIFCGILFRPTARLALQAAILLSLSYLVAGSILLPELWRDPLGPMMKVWPMLALNLLCLAMLDER